MYIYNELEDAAIKAYHNEQYTESDMELFKDELDIPALGKGIYKLKHSKEEDDQYEGGAKKDKPSIV